MSTWAHRKNWKRRDTVFFPTPDRPLMRALEPRILLDAASTETLLDAVQEAVHSDFADSYLAENFPPPDDDNEAQNQTLVELAPTFEPEASAVDPDQRVEIAFVTADVPDLDELIAGLPKNTEVVILDGSVDGISQIAAALSLRTNVDAIHIVSHGQQGSLNLGGNPLTRDSMTRQHTGQLALIGDALSEHGDILIYGCDFAGGTEGKLAAQLLADLTGADVAASTDVTGHADQGGDWDLELHRGLIEAEAFDAGLSWFGTLGNETLVEHTIPNFSGVDHDEKIGSDRIIGQTFEYDSGGATYEVGQIDLVLQHTGGSPNQDVIVSVRESYAGAVLAQGSLKASDLGSSYGWESFTLDSLITLNSNQEYFIVVETSSTSQTVEVAVEHDVNYSGGVFIKEDGTPKNNDDMLFRVINTNANTAPTITGGGFIFVDMDENRTDATTVVATDPDIPADTLTYSIVGGFDPTMFDIDPNSGELTFKIAPDFENPTDSNTNGLYTVEVEVSDGNGGTDRQTIIVTVRDANDAPVAQGDTVTIDEDTSYDFSTANFPYSDQDGNLANTITVSNLVLGGGSLVHTRDGTPVNVTNGMTLNPTQMNSLRFTPGTDENGVFGFDYVTNDADAGTVSAPLVINVTAVNDDPVITSYGGVADIDVDFDENQTVVTTIQASDVDLPADTLTYAITGGGEAAFFDIDANTGELTFTAPPDFENPLDFGTPNSYFVRVEASDGNGGSDSILLRIFIQNVNEAPTGSAVAETTAEDTAVNGTVVMTDPDAGDTPEATLGTGPANGTAVVNLDGTYTYTPALNFNGTDSFTVVVTDDGGLTDTVTVNVTVTSVNDDPTGSAVAVTTAEETAVNGTVVMSDVDVGDTPEATLGTGPANGSAVVNLDGTYTYTPALNFVGADSFTVVVTDDGGLTDTVTVNVTVTETNDAPTGSAVPVTTAEDTAVNGVVVMADVDAGDTPEATLGTGPANGTAVVNLDGTYTYTPALNFNGTDSFTVVVTDDDGLTDIVTVDVTVTSVNDDPTGSAVAVTTTEETAVNGTVVMSDVDVGDTPEATLGTGPANGTAVVNLDGTYTYTPALNFVGADSFTVVVTDDGGLTDTVTVNVTVTETNDAPTGSAVPVTTDEDTAVNGVVVMADVDAGDTPEATLGTGPANGTAVVNLDGTYTYTPALNFFGADSFTVVVTDDGGLTDTVTVDVTVTLVNDDPTITSNGGGPNSDVNMDEGQTFVTTVQASDFDLPADTITYAIVGGSSSAFFDIDPTTGDLTFKVPPDFENPQDPGANNSYRVRVEASDGNGGTDTQLIRVRVQDINEVPTGSAVPVTTAEDTAVNGTVVMSDVDAGDTPEATLGTGPANGSAVVNPDGTYTYTPALNFVGADSFTVVVTDDGGLTATVTVNVTVTPVNDAPTGSAVAVTTAEETTVNGTVVMNDIDVGDTPEATLGSGPANGTAVVNLDGTYSYAPALNFVGADSFTVVVTDDGGLTATVTVDVTVMEVNDAPTGSAVPVTTAEDTAVTGTVVMSDVDAGDTPEATLAIGPNNGSVVVNPDGTYIYSPALNYSGADSFTVTVVDDGGLTDLVTVNVTVTPVNDAPIVSPLADLSSSDADVVFQDVSGAFIDPEGDVLTFSATGLPDGLTINPLTGQLTGTIASDASSGGPYSVEVTVSDGNGGMSSAQFQWSVSNLLPVAGDDVFVGIEDMVVSGTVATNDYDPEGDALTLTFALLTDAGHGTVALQADGSFQYQPHANYFGTDSFTYNLIDSDGGVVSANAMLTVTAVNDAPISIGNSVAVLPETPTLLGPASFIYIDVENDPLASVTFTELSLNGGELTYNGGASTVAEGDVLSVSQLADLSFTSAPGATTASSFDYLVNDADVGASKATMTIQIAQPSIIDPGPETPEIEGPDPESPEEVEEPEVDAPTDEEVSINNPVVPSTPPVVGGEPDAPDLVVAPTVAGGLVQPDAGITPTDDRTKTSPDIEPKLDKYVPVKTDFGFAPVERTAIVREVERTGDEIRQSMNVLETAAAKVTFTFGSLLSVGGVSFILRSGALAAALMSALPAWNKFDPITIVAGRRDDNEEDEQTDYEMMMQRVRQAQSRVAVGNNA